MDSTETKADEFRGRPFDEVPDQVPNGDEPCWLQFAGEPSGVGGVAPDEDDRTWSFPLEPLGSLALERRTPWLIKGLLPASGMHVIYGQPAAGKSFVALHAALHVATGRRWAGRRVRQRGVVYVASEGSLGFRRRVIAARNELGIPHGRSLRPHRRRTEPRPASQRRHEARREHQGAMRALG